MTLVYKICPAELWREAEAVGAFAGAPVDLADGFIHFSTARQLPGTAARHFRGQGDLVLVAIDADALGPALRYEPSRGGDLFPHLFGPLPMTAVREVAPLTLDPDGVVRLPALPADDPALDARPGFDPEAAGWTRRSGREFMELVGPIWTKKDEGRTRYGFLAETRHLNTGGRVHGGMLMTFADQALGMTSWAANRDRPQVTIQLDVHFVSGATLGEFVEADCRIRRQTRSLMFMSADLTVSTRLVATASGVWRIRGAAEATDGKP